MRNACFSFCFSDVIGLSLRKTIGLFSEVILNAQQRGKMCIGYKRHKIIQYLIFYDVRILATQHAHLVGRRKLFLIDQEKNDYELKRFEVV